MMNSFILCFQPIRKLLQQNRKCPAQEKDSQNWEQGLWLCFLKFNESNLQDVHISVFVFPAAELPFGSGLHQSEVHAGDHPGSGHCYGLQVRVL